MLTLKLRDMVDMKEALKRVIQIKMPIQTSFKLSRIAKKINEELITLGASIDQLIAEESQEVEGKKVLPQDKIAEVNKKIDDLLKIEINIDCDKIKISDLGNIEIASEDLMLCDKLFIE